MGDVPFYAKIWPKLTHSLAKRRFSIYFRSYSASAVTPSLYFPGLSRRLAAIHQNCIVISATGNGTYSLLKICLRDLLLSYIGPIWLVVPLLWNIAPPKKTRNSSGDEIANVNFLTDDIVHTLQNTIETRT